MGFQVGFQNITDFAQIGTKDMSFLESRSPHWQYIPGTLTVSGPSYFNNTPNIGIAQASVMVGPPEFECNEGKKQELDHEHASKLKGQQLALQVDGFSLFRTGTAEFYSENFYYSQRTTFAPTKRYAIEETFDTSTKHALNVGNDNCQFNKNVFISGRTDIGGSLKVGGVISCAWLNGQLATARALPAKPFDIKHPSKDGWRLRHVSLEGPEIGVYFRGELQGTNEIELPDYWKDLVDEDTITAHLTPIGSHQNLCYAVARMKGKTSILVNPHGFNTHTIRCSYIVYGERKDLKPLITEYEGNDMFDYPGEDFVKLGGIE